MTKDEKTAAMYSSYRAREESFDRCGCCHKPLITCMCDPNDVEDDEPVPASLTGSEGEPR